MSANIEGMLNEAQREIDAGRKDAAMTLLLRVTELDERNERAWLLLAMAVDSAEEKRTCLDNVLIINPNNAGALRLLDELDLAVDNNILAGDNPFGFDTADDAESLDDASSFSAEAAFDPPPASSGSAFDGPFGMDEEEDSPAPVSRRPVSDVSSGGVLGDVYEEEGVGDAYDYNDDDMGADYDYDESDEIYDDDEDYGGDDEADDLLGMIPDDVRPTRSPGMDETPNSGLMVGIWVLGVLNVLGIGVLVFQLLV